jgi:Periplasmic binding protein
VTGVVLATSGVLCAIPVASPAGAAGDVTGVTSTSIKIGIPYVDLASVAQFTHGLSQGNYQAVYQALINAINKGGGINGRKIQASYAAVNPIGTASSSAACTQLIEDDQVFAVLGFFQNNDPLCYTQLHSTPIIGGTMTTQLLANSKAAWFSTTPIDNVIEPAAINAFARAGAFKSKRVAVLSLSTAPAGLASSVVRALARNGVTPVATATVLANDSDPEASLQQIGGVVALKFRSAGANVVVPVGEAAQTWGTATASGSYHPQIVAPSYNSISTYTSGTGVNPAVIAKAVSAYLIPLSNGSKAVGWSDPSMQRCVRTVRAAGQRVVPPTVTVRNGDDSYVSVVQACQNLALFTAIVRRAGKNLNDSTFQAAGNTLGLVHIPAVGSGIYSKRAPAGTFPLYVYNWVQSQNAWIAGPTPYSATR